MKADHRRNRLLAELEPEDFAPLEAHLDIVELVRKQVLYEPGDVIRHVYFPHDAIISLVRLSLTKFLAWLGSLRFLTHGRGSRSGYVRLP